MELFTTKIKIILFLTLISLIIVAAYWVFRKHKQVGASKLGAAFTVPVDRVYKKVLSNGMHVLVFKNQSLPKVLVQIAYDVGSYVEESGERGLAHLVEHMIYKGTNKLSETDIDTIARKYGASFNAFTSMDVTSYYFETNKNNWKPFLEILADCMQNTRFDEQHLASEIKAVIQELKMGKDNYWRTMILKACELSFPPYHPYHTPTIGFKEDLLSLNAENLKKFYKKYYRPDRATLFIVGDVDPEEALAQAQKDFENIKAEKELAIKTFPALVPELATYNTTLFEDVKKAQLGLYWVIPGLKSKKELAISALESILGSGQSGRLYRTLIDEYKVATSVYVTASKFMEAGLFLILIEPLPGKTEQCIQLIEQELAKIVRDGVEQRDLERVAKSKSKNFFNIMQDYHDFVYSWIESYFATGDELAIFKRVNNYFKLDTQQIKEIVVEYLDPFFMNRIQVLPLPEAKKQLCQQIKKYSDELDQKILAKHIRTAPIEEPRAANQYQYPEPLAFTFPKPEREFMLPNGLKVLLAPNHYAPLITLNCQYKQALFLDEVRDGIAVELMMDMLMEDSKGHSKKDNVDLFEQNGASYAFDAHGARFSCLKQDFTMLVQRFVTILLQPTFPKDSLEKLKTVFVENYERAKDSPKSVGMRLLKNMIYKNHPYSWTFDQAISLVKNLDVANLKALHKEYLAASNIILTIVGDFDANQMEKTIKKLFDKMPGGTEKIFPKTSQTFIKDEKIDYEMLRDQIILLFGRPSTVTVYDPDLIPLKIINIISFHSLGSRIFKVREQTGLFYSAFGAFATHATKEHGFDYVGMIVSPENVGVAEKQVYDLLNTIARDGFSGDELDAARSIYLKDLIDLVSDNTSIARMLCKLESFGLDFDYYDKVLQRVQNIQVDEINKIAKKYCAPNDFARVRVGHLAK